MCEAPECCRGLCRRAAPRDAAPELGACSGQRQLDGLNDRAGRQGYLIAAVAA